MRRLSIATSISLALLTANTVLVGPPLAAAEPNPIIATINGGHPDQRRRAR